MGLKISSDGAQVANCFTRRGQVTGSGIFVTHGKIAQSDRLSLAE